ncbi:MAG TPA: type IV pilus biogenesis/stability protein PilW [Gammaproteobacteria bacterium]|nr:type IV pilus biogenesis/stability protein PilW [Gammaproteobacteria bacterium]
MNRRAALRLGAFLVVLALAGCATQGNTPFPESVKQAARLNTQLGIGYMQQEQYELAKQKLMRALSQADLPETHVALAELYRRMDRDKLAEKQFRKALDLAPDRPETHNNYGVFLCDQGRYKDAVSQFMQAVNNPAYSTPAYAYTNAGLCVQRKGDSRQAGKYFRQALQVNPRFGQALYQMAALSYRKGKYMNARAFLERYAQVAPPTPDSLWLAVRTERKLGNKQAAAKYAQKLRKQFPDSDQANKLNPSR